MTTRLTDEELAELDSMSEAAEGCDCGCASSRAAFGCADAIPVLLAEVRQVRKLFEDAGGDEHNVLALVEYWGDEARAARADERAKVEREIVEWIRDETAEADYGQGVARLIIDAIERGEHRR